MIYSVFMRKVNRVVLRNLIVFVCVCARVCVCVCVCCHNDSLLNFAREVKFLVGDVCFCIGEVRVHK